jgi:methylglutaconyl-CoA hydratase
MTARRHVWLNRPDVRNAFNEPRIAELALAFDANWAARMLVRAVVLARERPGLLRRRGPELDEEDGRLFRERKPGRRHAAWPTCCAPSIPVPEAGGRQGCRATAMPAAWAWRRLRHRGGAERVSFCLSEVKLGLIPAPSRRM